MKRFACGDVVPGCTRTFVDSSEDLVLAAAARHAASEHGLTAVGPELVSTVRAHIRAA